MALLTNRLQELLPLFPAADHEKLKEVYRKIPGTLLKFLNPIQITNKVECQEQNLQMDLQEPNKYRQPLMMFLTNSIGQRFHEQKITEVPPKLIAEDIVTHCFDQCPDWGRHRCQQPSVIVRFDSNFINTETTRTLNINVYTYAFLQFHYKESLFSLKNRQAPRISFEVTIELNGMAIDAKKIKQVSELLQSGQCLEEVIEVLESTSKVTLDNLDNKSEVKSPSVDPPAQVKLSWDAL